MAIVALIADQGVRKGDKGKHHADYKISNMGRPYLFLSQSATHVGIDNNNITVFHELEKIWQVSRKDAPQDWLIALMQTSQLYLVQEDLSDPQKAVAMISSGVESQMLPLKILNRHQLDIHTEARNVAMTIRNFTPGEMMGIPTHRNPNHQQLTFRDFVGWQLGNLMPQHIEIYFDEQNRYLHLDRKCANTYKHQNVSLAQAISHACPNCGLTKEKNLSLFAQQEKYHPVSKIVLALAPIYSQLSFLDAPLDALKLMQYENYLDRTISSYSHEQFSQQLWSILTHVRIRLHQAVFSQANIALYEYMQRYLHHDFPQLGEFSGQMAIIKISTTKGFPETPLAQAILCFYGYMAAPLAREVFTIVPEGVLRALQLMPGIQVDALDYLWPGEDYTTLQSLANASRDSYVSKGKLLMSLRAENGLYHPHQPFGARSKVLGGVL